MVEWCIFVRQTNKDMSKIAFTSGTLLKLTNDYYNLELSNNGTVVYKATLPRVEACKLLEKHPAKINMA